MTKEWAQLKAACLLEGTSIDACARKFRKTPKALYRAMSEPNFSKPLRTKLLSLTDRLLQKHGAGKREVRAA